MCSLIVFFLLFVLRLWEIPGHVFGLGVDGQSGRLVRQESLIFLDDGFSRRVVDPITSGRLHLINKYFLYRELVLGECGQKGFSLGKRYLGRPLALAFILLLETLFHLINL